MAVVNVAASVGLTYKGVVAHYRGDEANMVIAPEFKELVSNTHTHMLAITMVFFLLGAVFMLTNAPDILKTIVPGLSFLAIIVDLSSMWLVRYVAPQFAITMLAAGMTIGVCALIETAMPLYEMWIKKK
jgi:hypothetical protein